MKPSLDCRISKSQVLALLLTFLVGWSHATAQTRERRNFYGMHNLKDGGTSIPEGMNWTRHMVGEGGWVFDWVRGDYGKWVVDAMDRGLIPVLRVQDCNGGCDPNDGHPGNVAAIIRQLGVSSGTLFDDIVVRGPAVVPPPPPPDNRPPISAVTADPTSGVVPLTVSFDGSASTDPDGDALTFNWTFGDGEQGSGVSVSHTYALSGTFTATLAVTDGRGGSDTSSVVITVSDSVPPPVPPSVEWDARLDTLGVFLEEADVAAGTFYWKLVSADFESDGEVLPPPGGGNESGGRHAVFVKALNEGGNPIENQKVIASWPTGNPTTAVEVFTKGPFDNFWGDFPMSGGNWCPSFPEGPRGPYGTYIGDARSDAVWGMAMPCNRHVSFRLVWQWTQKTGGDQNDPPLASASANPINGNAPLVVTLDGSVSSDPDGDPLTYTWSFGDGQAGAGAIVSHTYEQSGSFDATLTVDDGRGASASTTIRIEVGSMANAPPIAFASASTNSGTLPLTVTFDASGSSDPDGDPLSYSWDFGNGQQGSGVSVAHTYDLAGTFNVHLTVQDGRGGTDTSGITVTAISPGGGNAKSKLTIHAGFGGPLSMQFVAEAKPRIIKILDSFSAAPEIKRISPETQIIGRAFLANQPMDGDPIQRAREWWSQNANLIQQFPDVDYWEGYNEPIIQSVELMGWFAQFEAERVRILAANGLKAVIANFSVGNPDLPLWPAFYPAIDAAIAHGGILGLHEYGTPMQQHFDFASGEGWFAGRYRKVYRQFLIPEGKVIPLAITECGVDVVPPVGWKNHFTEAEYLDQLKWYDSILLEDDYVLGATIFALEIPGWGSFDIALIVDELSAYVGSQTLPPPPPPPPNGEPDAIVESVSVVPAQPEQGQVVTFTATVTNVGGASTPAGVPIGVGYFVDGDYKSYGITSEPLAAGASVTLSTQGGPRTATSGAHTLTALVDDINRFAESNEGNNELTTSFVVAVPTPGPGLPDVIVDSVTAVPAQPSPGEQVSFHSVVRNVGTAATPSGVPVGVAYFIDGAYQTWGSVTSSLAPGATVTITTQGGPWAAVAGSHQLTALVDDVNRFTEANENNNSTSATLTVGSSGPPPARVNLYGMNIDPANPHGNPSAQALQEIGVRWVRIEGKVSPGFAFYDSVIAAYRDAGIKVMLLLDYATVPGKPASNAGDAEWASYLASFLSGVSAVTNHYRDSVDAWQIWNEPDLSNPGSGYDPGVPAHHFGAMQRDGVAAIRPYSSRPIVTAGLASGDPEYLARARDAVGGLTIDAVAVHPYGQRAPDDWPNPQWGFGNMSDLFDRYLVFGLPLWVTEIGTVDQTNQAAYLENVYQLAEGEYAGRVERVFWFCWSDGMVPPFGVLSSSDDPKPAYWRYRDITP